MSENNVQIIQACYEAFGRADIPTILSHTAQDVDWQEMHPHVSPVSGNRKGHEGAISFFKDLAALVDFSTFEPRQFLGQGDTVVVLGFQAGTLKPTGRKAESEFAHVFTLKDGKIARWRGFADPQPILDGLATEAKVGTPA